MDKIKDRSMQFHDGLITSREYLSFLIEEIGQVWSEGTEDNETEAIAKLANWLASRLA